MSLSPVGLDKVLAERREPIRLEPPRHFSATESVDRVGSVEGAERKAQLRELRDRALEQSLEVQLKPLPEANVVVIRFVNPTTGDVVREYPSEQIATALAELRTKIADRENCVNRCA